MAEQSSFELQQLEMGHYGFQSSIFACEKILDCQLKNRKSNIITIHIFYLFRFVSSGKKM